MNILHDVIKEDVINLLSDLENTCESMVIKASFLQEDLKKIKELIEKI